MAQAGRQAIMQRRMPKLSGTSMRFMLVALVASLVAWVGACATRPELLPASGHTSAMGRSSLAVESRSGVTVTADGSVWDSSPKTLATELTPVWVTLHNETGRSLRVQYDEFTLRGESGATYIALAPCVLPASRSSAVFQVQDGGDFDKFQVVPYLAASYPWLPVWNGPLPHGPSIHSVAWRAGLPTDSMLERALPEGVLGNSGNVSGFLYFQKVDARESGVTFRAGLQEPTPAWQPARQVAAIDIPFRRVDRRPPKENPYTAPRGPDWIDN
jgi:hypothetical protein